jgi:tRNA G18 (ribose-2'-O)-methylase SpoU
MKQLAHTDIPRLRQAELAETVRHPVVLLLDRIRSAQNVGALLRTADGLGLSEVIMTGFTPDGDHKAVHKSALSAQHFIPWRKEQHAVDVIHSFKQDGWTIAALEITDTPSDVSSLSSNDFPLLLILGNEVDGVSEELLAICDIALELPQYGAKQSLNVSVATGVICYDLVRRYRTLSDLPLSPAHDHRVVKTASPTHS